MLYFAMEKGGLERIEFGAGAYLVFESVNEDLHYFLLRGRWDVIGVRQIRGLKDWGLRRYAMIGTIASVNARGARNVVTGGGTPGRHCAWVAACPDTIQS